MKQLEVHPLTRLFPPMTGEEYAELKRSIEENGQREEAWVWEGKILDGVHRQKACVELGRELRTREWSGNGSAVALIVDLNKNRRHLTTDQRVACAVEIKKALEKETRRGRPAKENPANLQENPGGKEGKDRGRESAGKAARVMGVKQRRVYEQEKVAKVAPELHEKVKNGQMTHAQAKREVTREEKRREMAAKASAAVGTRRQEWDILCGDCVQLLQSPSVEPRSARLIFADPPYNLGVDYGEGEQEDRLPDEEYLGWCEAWLRQCAERLTDDGSLWLLVSDEYADHLGVMLRRVGLHRRNWIKWYETFGVNCANKFNRCSRHLFYAVKDPRRFVFNADAVRRPSDRLEKYEDARADPAGKVWDDVWVIPRLAGTHKERIPEFPTQLPLVLLRPIIGCASEPGDLVIDPFCGSGTTGEAAIEAGRRFVGIEKQARFAQLATLRLEGVGCG